MDLIVLSLFPNLLVNRMANTEAGEAMIVAISGDPFAAALNGWHQYVKHQMANTCYF